MELRMQSKTVGASMALAQLKAGGVGVMPTDTIYGIVARAQDKSAVNRLYSLKDRHHKPGTVIAASIEQLIDLGLDPQILRGVAHLWPNPLSIVVSAPAALGYLHQDVGSLAVRIPQEAPLRALLEEVGPLLTSSANHPSEPGAVNVKQAQAYFEDEVDFYVDGGDLSGRAPSTIIRVTDDGIEVIREGAVKLDSLSRTA